MKVLTSQQISRVFEVTDSLDLHRNWVVVPLTAHETGAEFVMPDGKVLLRPPAGPQFDAWIRDLRERLQGMDISRTPRGGQHDPKPDEVPPEAPYGSGSRRLYLHWKEEK